MIVNYSFYLILAYFVILNLLGFLLMGVDKMRAKNGAWRISERNLLIVALLGGGIGSLIGMYTFRHKTKHLKFRVIVPFAAVLTVALFYACLFFIS
jgi:uncharacterized membrane protein YsdA (DUF1294 family)